MLIGISGYMGSGKTVLMVKYLKQDAEKNRQIFSNTPLYGIPYSEFEIEKFLLNEYTQTLTNATIGLDEITVYMDCRLNASKQNILMGYLVLQSRKRHIDIYYTTQDFSLVEYNRLLRYTNILIFCDEIFVKDRNGKKRSIDNYRKYTIVDLRRHKENIVHFKMDISKYYKYYDTDYIIEPIVKYKHAKKKTA